MLMRSPHTYGQSSTNRIQYASDRNVDGARALLETFYYAFNHRDMNTFSQVWAAHEFIQLNNPLGGILRGYEPIAALYQRILAGPAKVWVELGDIVEFQAEDMVVFAGRERGEFSKGSTMLSLAIRTTRVVQWLGVDVGWRQTHHHGSIDDPQLLTEYQRAVRGD